jgi:hypothetical protein
MELRINDCLERDEHGRSRCLFVREGRLLLSLSKGNELFKPSGEIIARQASFRDSGIA